MRVVLACAWVRRCLLSGWKTDHKLACLGSFDACVDRRDSRSSWHAFPPLDNPFLHRIRAMHAVQLVIQTYSLGRISTFSIKRKKGLGAVGVKQKRQDLPRTLSLPVSWFVEKTKPRTKHVVII